MKLKIDYSHKQETHNFVPEKFYCDIITFSKVFVDELMLEITNMPVLLCSSDDFFRRFTNSVCLKLINNDDPEVGFLKVMAFLVLVTSLSFVSACYRPIDEIPTILRKLLKEHIKTKFYEEGRFAAISEHCALLKEEDKWYKSTVEEMRTYMNESLKTELAATKTSHSPFQQERAKIRIVDVRSQPGLLKAEGRNCPYCGANCIFFLREFWRPKIVYKPECYQM
ncbi:unnamed protein product [Larinioides sclopetarius]|uniref:Uncharacterized protein n=1 Tax=Larinioides sclopetarius TaxID=280406 RepID=A0AAV2AU92_9ARAC